MVPETPSSFAKPAKQPEMGRFRKFLVRVEQGFIHLPWPRIGQGVMAAGVLVGTAVAVYYRAPLGEHVTTFVAQATGATVQSLAVEGMVYTPKADMQRALGLRKGDSLVGFDTAAARARIEALPWVRLASVERQLPATVKVTVYEHVPLARVVAEDQVWVINQNGERIAVDADNRFAALPLLQGDGAATAAGPLFATMSSWPQLFSQLREAHYVGQRRWDLRFVSGVTVQLPEATADFGPATALPILAKLEEARHVLTLNAGEVDLRLRDRIFLRLPADVGATPVTNQPAVNG